MGKKKKNSFPELKFETKELDNGALEFELSDGRTAVVRPGRGKHMRNAQRIAGEDPSLYMGALMSQLVDIDGKAVTAEDLDEYPLKDYSKITQAFNELNF